MNIAVVGIGYIGLVIGTFFAETGNKVTCVDKAKVKKLSDGQITTYELGLKKYQRGAFKIYDAIRGSRCGDYLFSITNFTRGEW